MNRVCEIKVKCLERQPQNANTDNVDSTTSSSDGHAVFVDIHACASRSATADQMRRFPNATRKKLGLQIVHRHHDHHHYGCYHYNHIDSLVTINFSS